jgi:hypothetical protein
MISFETLLSWADDIRAQWLLNNTVLPSGASTEQCLEELKLIRQTIQATLSKEKRLEGKIDLLTNANKRLEQGLTSIKEEVKLLTNLLRSGLNLNDGEILLNPPSVLDTIPLNTLEEVPSAKRGIGVLNSVIDMNHEGNKKMNCSLEDTVSTKSYIAIDLDKMGVLQLFTDYMVRHHEAAVGANRTLTPDNLKKYNAEMHLLRDKLNATSRVNGFMNYFQRVPDLASAEYQNYKKKISDTFASLVKNEFDTVWPTYEKSLSRKGAVAFENISVHQLQRARKFFQQSVISVTGRSTLKGLWSKNPPADTTEISSLSTNGTNTEVAWASDL